MDKEIKTENSIDEYREYEKYTTIDDKPLRSYLEDVYKDEFKEGYFIDEIFKTKNGEWLLRWKRNLL